MKMKRRFACILLSIVMVLGLMPGMSLKAYAATTNVSYIERSWSGTQVVSVSKNQNCTVYNIYHPSDITTTLNGWYYFDQTITIHERLSVPAGGVANIIIKDGVELRCMYGINVPARATLNIYGQSEGTGTLRCEVSSGEHAAIGSNNEAGDCGTVNIYGCNVRATGGKYGAGIGGGDQCKGGNISIYGGDITATGGFGGAGIGGGDGGDNNSGNITIYGGNVTANGGDEAAGIGGGNQGEIINSGRITIKGGTVTATGGTDYGAGIGGGDQCQGGTIVIDGGNVTATGGKEAAGIGGGDEQEGGTINITGGDITAKGGNEAAGIGGGDEGNASNHGVISISSGTVTATGGSNLGAGIGGGDRQEGGTINITGGDITARGGKGAAGIGGGGKRGAGKITINGGKVKATGGEDYKKDVSNFGGGAGIGTGYNLPYDGDQGTITIDGGEIDAKGGDQAAGMGGGCNSKPSTIIINKGTVKAQGGTKGGAGIGTGCDGDWKSYISLTINGGDITAIGGEAADDGNTEFFTGAAIGGAGDNYMREYDDWLWSGFKGSINLNGGTIHASYAGENIFGVILIGGDDNKNSRINIKANCKIYVDKGNNSSNVSMWPMDAETIDFEDVIEGSTVYSSKVYNIDKDSDIAPAADRVAWCKEDYNKSIAIVPCDHAGATYTAKDDNTHTITSCPHCTASSFQSEDHSWGATTYTPDGSTSGIKGTHSCTKCGKEVSWTEAKKLVKPAEGSTVQPSVTTLTYGQQLSELTFDTAVFCEADNPSTNVKGTLSWKYPEEMPAAANTYNAVWVFTPTKNSLYAALEGTVNITVAPKEVGLEWSDTELTYNGEAQGPTAVATELLNGDTCTVTVTGEQTNAGDNYTATVSSLSNNNYKLPENRTTTFKINKAASVAAEVTANNRTYDGTEQQLVTVTGEPTGGTMNYALGENAATAPADDLYTTDIPAKTDAGTYYVWYYVKGDDNHLDTDPVCIESTIRGVIQYTVTFKVVNGSWDNGDTADKTVTLTGHEGDKLKLTADQIPAVGTKPVTNYKAGSWNTTPNTTTEITDDITYTYTYAAKENISATVTFKVVNGSWDDGNTADKTVTLTGYEGDTLNLTTDQIPAVGNKPTDTYKPGSWDIAPNVETAITGNRTYTYTYAQQDSISRTVTFKVENGSWDDGNSADITVSLTGLESDTLKLATNQIPAVGNKPNETYKAGGWNVTPSTDTEIVANTTYTYTYAKKDSISQTVTFKVVNGSWDEGEGDAATAEKTVTLAGYEGGSLKLTADQIPAVGNKPTETYKAGSWDVEPSTDTEIREPLTYTYTYAAKDRISATVTFKVENGSWDDGTTADKTVTMNGYEGDALNLTADQIPGVGTKPTDTYKAGSWDIAPNVDTAITRNSTYTYTYAPKNGIRQTVTFKVVNGSWDDGTTANKNVTLTGYKGDTLKLVADQIPTVGNKPNDTYKAGRWDVEPSTEKAITAATTYTYTYEQKDAATVTSAPSAKTLTYTGEAQALVTAGTASGGTMYYALGENATAAPADDIYTKSIPAATDAGTYYVWYKVKGDENHSDTAPTGPITVTITKKADPSGGGDGSSPAGGGDSSAADPVRDVTDMIDKIPYPVSAEDADAVKAARDAYDKLTDEQKKGISEDVLQKLIDAEAAIDAEKQKAADQAAANGYDDMIAGLPADVSTWTRDQLNAAREAYNDLTDAQKALVDPASLNKLQTAEFSFASADARAKKVKFKSVKAKKGRKAQISWTKNVNAAGYQLEYSTSRKFTKKTTRKSTIKSNKTVKKTIKKLRKGKTYYFRVRPYTKVYNGVTGKNVTVYGKWSGKQKCKAK